eukprot:5868476-Amphidinium_carterae.2
MVGLSGSQRRDSRHSPTYYGLSRVRAPIVHNKSGNSQTAPRYGAPLPVVHRLLGSDNQGPPSSGLTALLVQGWLQSLRAADCGAHTLHAAFQ